VLLLVGWLVCLLVGLGPGGIEGGAGVDQLDGRFGRLHHFHHRAFQFKFTGHQALNGIDFLAQDALPDFERGAEFEGGRLFGSVSDAEGVAAFAVPEIHVEVDRFRDAVTGVDNEVEITFPVFRRGGRNWGCR
jgi:hypothetical protein